MNYSSNSKLLVTKNGDVPRETKGMKGRQKRRGEDDREKVEKTKRKEVRKIEKMGDGQYRKGEER